MKRRDFLVATGAALAPEMARAQSQPPVVGVMRGNAQKADVFVDVFKRDMARLDWQEGKTYRTQFLFADGDTERLPAMAAELVKAGARVLVPFGNLGVAAAQKATKDIPIVGMADDLVAAGLAASMARPGGNTTGVSIMGHELDSKRLEVLHEMTPSARRIGVILDPGVAIKGEREKFEQSAAKLGLQLVVERAAKPAEIAPALVRLAVAKVEAVQFLASPIINAQRAFCMDRMREMKMPAIYEWPETVEEGGLVSYAPRRSLCYRHVAVLVSKVLHGAKPADLPVEQPTTFTLAINMKTAKALGLTIPSSILARGDEVIE